MRWTPWKAVLTVGIVAAIVAALLGSLVQGVVLLMAFLSATIGGVIGVVKWKPERRLPWLLVVSCTTFFLIGSIWKAMGVSAQASSASVGMSPANAIGIAAYLAIIAGVSSYARLRSNEKDPTNLIDALILTGGIAIAVTGVAVIPMLADPRITSATKVTNTIFDVLDLVLLFNFARMAMGPGVKNASYRLLSLAPISILVNDQLIALSQADIRFTGISVLMYLVPTIGCAAGAAAALHPSMVEIARPARVEIGLMTPVRFVLTMAALSVAPLSLLLNPAQYWHWVIPAWMALLTLAMIRFNGLVKARERVAELDAILAEGSAALVGCASTTEMYEAAMRCAVRLVPRQLNARFSICVPAEGRWTLVASRNWLYENSYGIELSTSLVRTLENVNDRGRLDLSSGVIFPSEETMTPLALGFPLVFDSIVQGIFIVQGTSEPSSVQVDALVTLTTRLTLALQTASLTEDIHRRRSERRFRALVENSNDILLVMGDNGVATFVSPGAERVLDWAGAETNLFGAVHEADRAAAIALVRNAPRHRKHDGRRRTVEFRIVDQGGSVRWFEATASDMRHEPEVNGVVVNAHEITDRKMLENDLRHRVLHDDLTGIPNRVLLRERVDHCLAQRSGTSTRVAMLFIDLDDFKTVNDGLGHTVGDELLKIIAFRIQNFVREGDTAARLGGDEFAVLLERLDGPEGAEAVAERLLEVLREPVEFDERQIVINASIGVAYAEDGFDSGVLLRSADVAMYNAKHGGKGGVATFDESMYVSAIERLELKADIARAIDNEEFVVYYQPLVHLATGKISGFEALVRWIHPDKGFISPGSFIPLAEETGAIVALGAWVMRQAVSQLAEWRRSRPDLDLMMSINLAPRQLQEHSIVDNVSAILTEFGVDAASVTLELTESENLDDIVLRDRLVALGALGVGIAADDFGSGFASYAALQQLPFSVVKIDRTLLLGLDINYDKAVAQLRSIIDMSHSTGLTVVVEGIEDSRQRDLVAALGCDKGQGFLLGRPGAAHAAEELLVAAPSETEDLSV